MTETTKIPRPQAAGKDQATPEPVLALLWQIILESRNQMGDNGTKRTEETAQ